MAHGELTSSLGPLLTLIPPLPGPVKVTIFFILIHERTYPFVQEDPAIERFNTLVNPQLVSDSRLPVVDSLTA